MCLIRACLPVREARQRVAFALIQTFMQLVRVLLFFFFFFGTFNSTITFDVIANSYVLCNVHVTPAIEEKISVVHTGAELNLDFLF